MQIDLEKILVHANEKLSGAGSGDEPLDAFKRFLKIETERLRIRHRFGLGGAEIMTGRSYMVDLVVSRACHLAAAELGTSGADLDDCAILALGGYGRRELAPFSDVDLLFLHAGRRSRGFREFVEKVLYLLWDMGLTVGHSFRSVSECVAIAKQDLHSRNAMAEARLVTGNPHLFRRLLRDLDDAVFKNRREIEAFIDAMRTEIEARYEKFGRTVCLQEPNVKESAGGLRDLHTVLWVGHARFGCRGLDDLRAEDFISGAEYGAARRASSFIARVRNEAHFSTSRRADLITLELQPALASNLGYKDRRGLLASELFMRDYYQRANELHQFSRSFLMRAMEPRRSARRFSSRVKRLTASFESRQGRLYLTMKRGVQTTSGLTASFEVKQGELLMKDEPTDLRTNPIRLLELFSVAQAEGVDLCADLKQIVRESLPNVGRSFRGSREAGRMFVEMLNHKGRVGRVLRMMYETGFLGRFLPEFARITFLVQHDFYHKYTIDEHTLKAIEVLDNLLAPGDPKLSPLAKVFAAIDDPAALYLGLLLHDIGKGRGTGHVARGLRIAETVCTRLGLEEDKAARVTFLVKQHLLMSHLSQRRDISEENLIQDFVDKVGDSTNLDMLLLLTYADTSGVGPGVWNDWKGTLLLELYTKARSHLTTKPLGRRDSDRKAVLKQQVVHDLLPAVLPSEVERHFAMMPDRYFRVTDPERIVEHFRMTRKLADVSLATDWRSLPANHCTELTVCTGDRSGLFARIAGTLTANGVNILSADLYTREDGVVLDTFKVSQAGSHNPVKEEKWPRVQADLKAAIENRYDVDAAVESWLSEFHSSRRRRKGGQIHRQPTVRFDSDVSAVSTVIEVRAEDEPGLAYRIARTLSELQLDISFARITTEKNFALDIFYVTGPEGAKLTLPNTQDVERALLDALSGGTNRRLVKEAV